MVVEKDYEANQIKSLKIWLIYNHEINLVLIEYLKGDRSVTRVYGLGPIGRKRSLSS